MSRNFNNTSGTTKSIFQITPGTTVGQPTTGFHEVGETFVDVNGARFNCIVSGTPGVWSEGEGNVDIDTNKIISHEFDHQGSKQFDLPSSVFDNNGNLVRAV